MSSEFVSVAQAAEVLGISRQAVLKRIRKGRLPATKVGRNYIVPVEGLRGPSTARDPMLAEILRRLLPIYEPERIYLFGSSARGVSRRGSDYDLMLVIPDDADEERARARRAYEVLWGLGVAVDVVIWRRGAFDARATAPTSLPATVMREGILLHAA